MQSIIGATIDIERILLACYVAPGRGETIHRNRPSHGFAIHFSGTKKFVFGDGSSYIVKKGFVNFMPKDSDYDVETDSCGDCYAINFDIDGDVNFAPFCTEVKNFTAVADMFKNAEKAFRMKKPWYEMQCKSELYAILCALCAEHETGYVPGSKRSIIAPAVEYIHGEYANGNIEIPKLAELCGVSGVYLRRLFHDCFGLSPVKYINKLKIERAKELIRSGAGMYTIEQAATLAGFGDQCYFHRFFKKEVGMTPSEYAQNKEQDTGDIQKNLL